MITFQDFLRWQGSIAGFVDMAIGQHKSSELYEIAKIADLYDKQKNKTINEYVRTLYTMSGTPVEDYTATNSKIASNFFRRLNTQRCTYSLGNGIYFSDDENNTAKEKLGDAFDKAVFDAGYFALIHGISFGFWNIDNLHIFPVTEFVPLWDELNGTLRAGIRFWQIDNSKPMIAVLYEQDGYTRFQTVKNYDKETEEYTYELQEAQPKRAYKLRIAQNDAGDVEIVGMESYSQLPIVPLWGSRVRQSTIVGMRQSIDSFDLIRSGFANDLSDCAAIYWLLSNFGGMTEDDLARFRDRMKLQHIVEAPGDGTNIQAYTQEVPYQARKTYLDDIRSGIYEDFGGLDVHAVSADSTNDHLEAAYQPLDENADDFEYQVGKFISQIQIIAGVEDAGYPIFKRNRISNHKEQTDMILSAAEYLDEETVLNKLPFITPDEVKEILARREIEDRERMLKVSEDEGEEDESEFNSENNEE